MDISMKLPSSNWATDSNVGISAPFIFAPLDLAGGAGETTGRIITNINEAPSGVSLVAGAGANSIDSDEGYMSVQGFTATADDTDGVWFGSGHDEAGSRLYDMFDLFNTDTFPNGKKLLINFRMKSSAEGGLNPLISFGSGASVTGNYGWALNHAPSLGEIKMILLNADSTNSGSKRIIDGEALGDGTEYSVTILIDTVNKLVHPYADGVLGTFVQADIDQIMDNITGQSSNISPIGFSFLAQDSTETADSRTFDVTGEGEYRDLFFVDLTDHSGTIDMDAIAFAFSKTPAGCLPHILTDY